MLRMSITTGKLTKLKPETEVKVIKYNAFFNDCKFIVVISRCGYRGWSLRPLCRWFDLILVIFLPKCETYIDSASLGLEIDYYNRVDMCYVSIEKYRPPHPLWTRHWQSRNSLEISQKHVKCVGFRGGAERSGLFCALLNVLYRVVQHNEVDVFNAVRRIRHSRPEFISSEVCRLT